MQVFVLDQNYQQRNPAHPALARQLLAKGYAAVHRRYPFTLILKRDIKTHPLKPIRLKIDPGASVTGLALLQDNLVIWKAELTHRGFAIRDALTSRRAIRRNRRNRKTRYRQTRFLNRSRREKWLSPSLMSRVYNILTWVDRLRRICNITALSQELVRFDLQKIEDTDISGVGYQQGTLAGYEIREFLLEKWQRQCAYCGAKDTQLEIDHIVARSKGGSNRVSNLTLACHSCNQAKGNQPVEEFLKHKPNILKQVRASAKKSLADAAAVNATRWELYRQLQATGLPVEISSGGRTKYNRHRLSLPKTHWLDAACVGKSTPERLKLLPGHPLLIGAKGHGTRQICRTNRFGFPIRHCSRTKVNKGFRTGDIVKAVVTSGKKIGIYVGRVATRTSGSFNVSTKEGLAQGISYKYCLLIHRKDGYSYGFSSASSPH